LCCHPYDCAGLLIAEAGGCDHHRCAREPPERTARPARAACRGRASPNAALRAQIEPIADFVYRDAINSRLVRSLVAAATFTSLLYGRGSGMSAPIGRTNSASCLWPLIFSASSSRSTRRPATETYTLGNFAVLVSIARATRPSACRAGNRSHNYRSFCHKTRKQKYKALSPPRKLCRVNDPAFIRRIGISA
jgi:hypothetical protein